ncbi:CCNT1 protein, partial [Todus mexicanus]|nr:CCNT1 protein [Todus mexicanus]
SQLTINTAIVYMHRFYMVQSFTQFHRNSVVPAALFLAAKVEEQPRKLEHVIKVANACLHHQETPLDTKSEAYLQQAQDLVILESIILQTLGFEITIDHPHTHVVKCTQLVRASKDLAQTSYFMATNSLHLTTFSLQYTPPVVACVCIHLACKWSNWEIPVSTDGKHWWEYVDGTVTLELLDGKAFPTQTLSSASPEPIPRSPFSFQASQAAAKKSKPDDHGEDENLSEQTILNMISRNNSSDMNIAGLMSMSTSSTAGAGPSLPSAADSPGDQSGADLSQPDHWHPPAKLELGQSHRTNESSSSSSSAATTAAPDPLSQQDGAGYTKPAGKNAPAAKVSLKEYRAKHAEELAAQKRQLENMEANVRSQYAYAAQNLLVQQQREREVHQDNSPIVLKLPLGSDNPERPPGSEKSGDKASALKLRLPMAGGGERPLPSKQEEIKMRIKVPGGAERHGSADDGGGTKSREHKEKHKGHSSNHHHHHHNHHSHKHLHSQLGAAGPSSGAASKRPADSKHGGQPGAAAGPHKSYGPLGSSRKRPLPDEVVAASAGAHEHQPKVGKASKGPAVPFPYPHLPGAAHLAAHGSETGNLPLPPAPKARGGHGKADKGP